MKFWLGGDFGVIFWWTYPSGMKKERALQKKVPWMFSVSKSEKPHRLWTACLHIQSPGTRPLFRLTTWLKHWINTAAPFFQAFSEFPSKAMFDCTGALEARVKQFSLLSVSPDHWAGAINRPFQKSWWNLKERQEAEWSPNLVRVTGGTFTRNIDAPDNPAEKNLQPAAAQSPCWQELSVLKNKLVMKMLGQCGKWGGGGEGKKKKNHYRAFILLLEGVREKKGAGEKEEGHTKEWGINCLREIANLSGLPGDRVPLWEPHSVLWGSWWWARHDY